MILEILNVSYSDFRFYIKLRCRGHDVQVGLLCGLKVSDLLYPNCLRGNNRNINLNFAYFSN